MNSMRAWAKNNATNASEDDGSMKEAARLAATKQTGGRFDSGIGIDDIING